MFADDPRLPPSGWLEMLRQPRPICAHGVIKRNGRAGFLGLQILRSLRMIAHREGDFIETERGKGRSGVGMIRGADPINIIAADAIGRGHPHRQLVQRADIPHGKMAVPFAKIAHFLEPHFLPRLDDTCLGMRISLRVRADIEARPQSAGVGLGKPPERLTRPDTEEIPLIVFRAHRAAAGGEPPIVRHQHQGAGWAHGAWGRSGVEGIVVAVPDGPGLPVITLATEDEIDMAVVGLFVLAGERGVSWRHHHQSGERQQHGAESGGAFFITWQGHDYYCVGDQ